MKRIALCQLALIGLAGCAGTSPVANTSSEPESVAAAQNQAGDSATATFVSLKVPNMT